MTATQRPQRKAAIKCKKKLQDSQESFDSMESIYQGDIPYIKEAYRNAAEADPQIGDEQTGQLTWASLPFPDDNADFKTYAIFANEPDKIFTTKATNLMQDVPAYCDHLYLKQENYEFVKDAVKHYEKLKEESQATNEPKEEKQENVAKGVEKKVCFSFVFIGIKMLKKCVSHKKKECI